MYRKRLVHATLAGLALALVTFSVPGSAAAQDSTGCTSLRAGFNGTSIPAGSTLWFNSVFKVKLPAGTNGPVNIFLNEACLTITTKAGDSISCSVPSAHITFDPAVTQATTTHDASDTFVTQVPASFGDNVFLTGLALPLPNGLPGGAKATFSGTFTTDTPGVTLQYQFAAAVYNQFSQEYDALGIKVTHGGPEALPYPGGDQAGTPENYAHLPKNVIGGGTGGGASNATGSYSATVSVTPGPAVVVVVV
jgi:hypothetical protein